MEKRSVFTEDDFASEKLLINPFFYKNKEGFVSSIEDFAIKVKLGFFQKQRIVYIHSLIRNNEINKKKRFKIFAKYLKANKKDFDENLSIQKKDNEKSKKDLSDNTFQKVGGKLLLALLFIVLAIVLTLMFSTKIVEMMGIDFLKTINTNLMNFKDNYNTYMLVGLVVVNLFPIWFFMYLLLLGISNKKYIRMQKRKQQAMEKHLTASRKAIKSCYNRVYRFYRANILKGNTEYEALVLDELWDLDFVLDENDVQTEEQARKNKKLIRRNKRFSGTCKLFIIINIILLVALLAFEFSKYFK